jgi:FtsP/CotA-like multicopper oxidase with cupredoxin domain
VWTYNGLLPGPEIRVRQGDRLKVVVANMLDEGTTVHWHGIRLPNNMDGVPHLTQQPIAPGETFTYEFDVPDAGTYWYHPHERSFEQVARGLAGALIVEEAAQPQVDRDVVWMLSDWRLNREAQPVNDFGNIHDVSHAGRVGNTVSLNGAIPEEFAVQRGERIRLRLINAASARIFSLRFRDHDPEVIAIDGHPVHPHRPVSGRFIVAPGMRMDLLLQMTGQPNARYSVEDRFYRGREYRLVDLVYAESELPPPLGPLVSLAPNPVAEPDLNNAQKHEILLAGGMMGRMSSATVDGSRMHMRDMTRRGLAWAINGVAASHHGNEPMIVMRRGSSHVLQIYNDTSWWHPMHLHGHAFRVLSRDSQTTRFREWQDTVLLGPQERVEVALVADNPGDWMFHCHVLDHQVGGMMATIRVV